MEQRDIYCAVQNASQLSLLLLRCDLCRLAKQQMALPNLDVKFIRTPRHDTDFHPEDRLGYAKGK